MTDNIPSWQGKVLKGLHVPADQRVAVEVKELSIYEWFKLTGINFMERVHGHNSRAGDFVMVIDEDGRQRRLPFNSRAQYLSGYPLFAAPILGDAIFWSEDYGMDGMDFVNLRPNAEAWLKDNAQQNSKWEDWKRDNAVRLFRYQLEFGSY